MRALQLLAETAPLSKSTVAAAHCEAIKSSLITDTFISNKLISRYQKCKELGAALRVFDEMPHRDTASWNTVISGYVNSGSFFSAWEVLKSMKRFGFMFDAYTFGSTLKGVAASRGLRCGIQVHSNVVKMGFDENVYANSALLDMYAKCSRVDDANKVFRHMKERNAVSWNALIGGFAEMGNLGRCLKLFRGMVIESVRVDDATFAPILTLLCEVDSYELARQIHGNIMKRGLEHEITLLNATITAYAECGSIGDSKKVFDNAEAYRDLVTWNSMLAAYLEHGLEECGFRIFLDMMRLRLKVDAYTCSTIISACSGNANKSLGKSLHCLVIKRGLEQATQVSNALISMYLKCDNQNMEAALRVFEHIGAKDHCSWNTILTGLSQNGMSENALRVFQQMHLNYVIIDQYAFSAVLRSCSDLATLNLGQQIHAMVLKSGLEEYEYVASALIFMYSKCGIIEDAKQSFEASRKESSVTWNSVIFAYAQHGQGKVALDLFYLMTKRNVKLDHVTFVAALTACSHIGLVEEGLNLLKSMESDYGVRPQMENYACAVDLLGRAGRLMEAKELVDDMPFQPDEMVLKTLLGACRACGDIELAAKVAENLLEMDPGDHCTYVLLSDMYGNLKKWDKKAMMKRMMRDKRVKKVPGWSWIELNRDVHSFNADDHSHLNSSEIYLALEELTNEMRNSDDALIIDIYPYNLDFVYGNCIVGSAQAVQI